MKIYKGSFRKSEEFIAENPTITIDEAQEILLQHNYHNSRSVMLDTTVFTGVVTECRVLIYESTKDRIEVICQECSISKQVSTQVVFGWMGY